MARYRYNRKQALRKRIMRKLRKYRRKAGFGKGILYIRRKTPNIQVFSTAVAGVPTVVDPKGIILTLGIPTSVPGATQCYDVPFSLKFRLDQITNNNELEVLFDRYKIKGAWIKAHLNTTNTSGGFPMPYIQYVTDNDDAAVPSTISMAQRMGTKTKYFSSSRNFIKLGCRPVPASEIFASGVATAYGVPRRAPFINMSNTSVEHYGIKGIIHNMYLPATAN